MGLTGSQYREFYDAVSRDVIPMKRTGTSEEMAKTILFMAADATYMTGATIVHDGGYVLSSPEPKTN